jgi:ribosomal protein S18 acetylase RimI-like enzyme
MTDTYMIRTARPDDADVIAQQIQELAEAISEHSPITAAYISTYLAFQGCGVLLAEQDGSAVGLLSYSIRANLYHAGPCGLIEELVVRDGARGRGIGKALIREALRLFESLGCAEATVSTLPDNEGALRLYRAMGFDEEAVLLEHHFRSG